MILTVIYVLFSVSFCMMLSCKIPSDLRRHEYVVHQVVQGQMYDNAIYQCDVAGCTEQVTGLHAITKHIKQHEQV